MPSAIVCHVCLTLDLLYLKFVEWKNIQIVVWKTAGLKDDIGTMQQLNLGSMKETCVVFTCSAEPQAFSPARMRAQYKIADTLPHSISRAL